MMITKKDKMYVVCIAGMALLLIAALLLPQIVFAMQDRRLLSGTEVETRNRLDISQLNSLYETNIHDRMSNLAAMDLKAATVTAIDYDAEDDKKIAEQLKAILLQEWTAKLDVVTLNAFSEAFLMMYEEDIPADIKDCKKYIVYKDDYREGIALMMWYYDVYLNELGTRIRILVDSETDTIYYVKITAIAEQTDDDISSDSIAGKKLKVVDKYGLEQLYFMTEVVRYHIDFYNTYYEAEMESFDGFEEGSWREKTPWYVNVGIFEKHCAMDIKLPYGNVNTDFTFYATFENGINPDVSMGISVIGELVPEMIQD